MTEVTGLTLETFFPFELRTFTILKNESLVPKEVMQSAPDYVMGDSVNFTSENDKWVGPDNRKAYAAQKNMLLVNCVHIITEGATKQIFDGKEYISEVGDGGWFYMPEEILETALKTDSPVAKVLAIDFRGKFIENRNIYKLKSGEKIDIEPSTVDKTARYVAVAVGNVIANKEHELTAVRLIRCKNPVEFVASTDSVLLVLDIEIG